MSWKRFFLESDGTEDKPDKVVEKKTVKMPTSVGTAVTTDTGSLKFPAVNEEKIPVMGNTNCAPHMDAVMSLYEKGFESLNLPGVEFFEFFKSIAGAGMNNPQAYPMAFNMLRGLEPSLTKEILLEKAQHYISEISKVHQGYESSGKVKRTEIVDQKNVETARLKSDVELLEQQLEQIKNQIEAKRIQLSQMDAKYNPSIEEIECKLAANDAARDKIYGAISKVAEGIKNNL